MMEMIPDKFAKWVMMNAPSDALHPTDFRQVEVWQSGWGDRTEVVDPLKNEMDIAKLYWRPAVDFVPQ